MPSLKRRAEAISRDPSDAGSDDEETPTQPQRRRRRSSSHASSASSAPSEAGGGGHNQEKTLVKKLVRLALATEYSRTPLRRGEISTKVFKESNATGRGFKTVFEGAQRVLKDTFGMQLVELPSKEKTTLKDRRTQATQTKASTAGNYSKSWILVSILPAELKTNPTIVQPSRAPNVETEASYTALYTFILSLIYLNNNSLTDQKLERYLRRVNADTYTPFGSLEKLLQRMVREGYVEKRRDTSSGEEVIEWVPGPRGKVEVGVRGVTGLVRSVYGHGAVPLSKERGSGDGDDDGAGTIVKMEQEELNARLSRSLGIKLGDGATQPARTVADGSEDEAAEEEEDGVEEEPGPSTQRRPQRTRAGGR